MTSVATTSASQKLPVAANSDHADIGAQHEQLAMGEVDHVHDAEDQGQPRGDQRQDHAGDDAVDGLDQDLVEGNAAPLTLPGTGG